MTIRKIEIFYTVSELLNMTEVAKKLYISQPSISQVIKELEETLKVKLFQRIGRKLYLTEEGRVFKNYSLRILNIYNEGLLKIEEMREVAIGSLKIGASTTIGTYILPKLIVDFKKVYSGVDIELIIENTNLLEKEVLLNKVDLAFVEGPIHSLDIKASKVWEDELVFISSCDKNWPSTINKEDLEKELFIQREAGSGCRCVVENALLDITFNNYFTFGNIEAIKRGVKSGVGVSCVSKTSIVDEVSRGELCISRLDGRILSRDLNLIIHRDKHLTPLLTMFLDFIKGSSDNYKF